MVGSLLPSMLSSFFFFFTLDKGLPFLATEVVCL